MAVLEPDPSCQLALGQPKRLASFPDGFAEGLHGAPFVIYWNLTI